MKNISILSNSITTFWVGVPDSRLFGRFVIETVVEQQSESDFDLKRAAPTARAALAAANRRVSCSVDAVVGKLDDFKQPVNQVNHSKRKKVKRLIVDHGFYKNKSTSIKKYQIFFVDFNEKSKIVIAEGR